MGVMKKYISTLILVLVLSALSFTEVMLGNTTHGVNHVAVFKQSSIEHTTTSTNTITTLKLGSLQSKINTMTLPFEMKVFIDDRYAFVDYTKITSLLDDLDSIYGFTVVSGDRDSVSYYNFTYLSQFDFFLLPNPLFHVLRHELAISELNVKQNLPVLARLKPSNLLLALHKQR